MSEAEKRAEREPEVSDDDAYDDGEDSSSLPWQWIAAAAVVLALLGGAYYGYRYWQVRRDVKAAERLVADGKPAEAAALLDATLARSPESSQALLLKMKAEFLSGNWRGAGELFERNAGRTVKGELAAEVNTIAQRAHTAVQRHGEAKLLFERGELDKAELLLTEAVGLYPESQEIRESLETVQGSQAFQKKDYARFVEIAERGAERRPDSPTALALLASALSAQYAATGEARYRERAEQALEAARKLAEPIPPARAAYEEYSERIRHRLQTREIIDRAEYDRRFRTAAAATPATGGAKK